MTAAATVSSNQTGQEAGLGMAEAAEGPNFIMGL
jgi:hypothetical protein